MDINSFLAKEELNGSNFLNWNRNLRNVLRSERKLYVLDDEPISDPPINAPKADKDTYKKYLDDSDDVTCLMLATMIPEIQEQHMDMSAIDMIKNLKELYEEEARRHELGKLFKDLRGSKMSEGSSVEDHVLKMIRIIERLSILGSPLRQDLAIKLVLDSLPWSYSQFKMIYYMNGMDKTLIELLNLLRSNESTILKSQPKNVVMIHNNKEKIKAKKCNMFKTKGRVAKKEKTFHCEKAGHWKRKKSSTLHL